MDETTHVPAGSELLRHYGRDPVQFSGHPAALLERHLLFNDLIDPSTAGARQTFEAAARSFGIQPQANPVRGEREIEGVVTALQGEPRGTLVVMPDSFNIVHRERIIALAARHRVPAIYPYGFAVREGGLLSYGVDQVDLFRRAGGYVGRILKGAKPAELPVQAPTKFEIVVNLKAAKALGVEVPQTLLAIADEVVE